MATAHIAPAADYRWRLSEVLWYPVIVLPPLTRSNQNPRLMAAATGTCGTTEQFIVQVLGSLVGPAAWRHHCCGAALGATGKMFTLSEQAWSQYRSRPWMPCPAARSSRVWAATGCWRLVCSSLKLTQALPPKVLSSHTITLTLSNCRISEVKNGSFFRIGPPQKT